MCVDVLPLSKTKTMFLVICVVTLSLSNFIFAADNGSPCETPNGERATCIPINSCAVIRRAIAYLDPEAVEFAKKSQCGYDEEPLVCCGTVGRITTPAPKVESTTVRHITSDDVDPPTPPNRPLLPKPTVCGFHVICDEDKQVSVKMEYPWTVLLNYRRNKSNQWELKCIGTLISRRYVVTVAECLSIPDFTLATTVMGEWKLDEDIERYYNKETGKLDRPAVISVPVENYISHPYFSKKSLNNNIGLIRLARLVQYTEFISPICLPPVSFPPPPPSTLLETCGWKLRGNGTLSVTKVKAKLFSVSFEECENGYPNFSTRHPNHFCARSETDDLCSIESGLPIIRAYGTPTTSKKIRGDQWYLEGIISTGFGCRSPGQPHLYIRISRYVEWILNNMEE